MVTLATLGQEEYNSGANWAAPSLSSITTQQKPTSSYVPPVHSGGIPSRSTLGGITGNTVMRGQNGNIITDSSGKPVTYGSYGTGTQDYKIYANTGLQNAFTPFQTTQHPQQQNWSLEDLSSLFNKQLESWWNTVKPTLQPQQQQGGYIGDQGLSALFPRVNWGNYQTANRGSRYFDQNTGNYTLDNTITMGT